MTGYTVHTGTSKKYASGWDQIFKDKDQSQAKPKNKTTAQKASNKVAQPKTTQSNSHKSQSKSRKKA